MWDENLNDQLDLEKDYELMSWAVPHAFFKKENGNGLQLIFPIGTILLYPPYFRLLLSNQGWLSSLITKLCTRGLELKEVISGLKNKECSMVFENKRKKSHSTLRAKRATFTFWVDKSLLKMPKMGIFENLKLAVKQCCQTGQYE